MNPQDKAMQETKQKDNLMEIIRQMLVERNESLSSATVSQIIDACRLGYDATSLEEGHGIIVQCGKCKGQVYNGNLLPSIKNPCTCPVDEDEVHESTNRFSLEELIKCCELVGYEAANANNYSPSYARRRINLFIESLTPSEHTEQKIPICDMCGKNDCVHRNNEFHCMRCDNDLSSSEHTEVKEVVVGRNSSLTQSRMNEVKEGECKHLNTSYEDMAMMDKCLDCGRYILPTPKK